ncbi:PilW family protein [uncultured Photobacterium sp.]|uniref:PilW family protein n=1 Tax=uncultured Photobacterium sp. TaxID=173973 RepID=UPI00262F5450|nr:prepilin-type N-terminal cleavage/methylation domain-containing protein [uncultured Photobacterium sp.]
MPVRKYSHGFTLIEMIMALVVLGVISLGIGSYVQLGTQGYIDTRDREQVQSQARFAVERLTRELRHAVPNSLDISSDNKCIRFTPIEYAGFYINSSLDDVDKLVGIMSSSVDGRDADVKKHRLAINPVRPADLVSVTRSAEIKKTLGRQPWRIKLKNKTSFESESVSERFYIYSVDVQFCLNGEQLTRATRPTGSSNFSIPVILAKNLIYKDSNFTLEHAALNRNQLVHFQLVFSNNGEQSQYSHDVQVMNVP